MTKRAFVQISISLLKEKFGIPDEVDVIGIGQDFNDQLCGQCTLLLSGPGLPDNCEFFEGVYSQKVNFEDLKNALSRR